MSLTRDQFAENLRRGTQAVRKNTAVLCWNELPQENRYFIILNGSFDANPLAPGEHIFPDHDMPQVDIGVARTAEEVVEKLWRDGKVPEWIDISPFQIRGDCLYLELLCCGRFTDQEPLLYHKQEGYPPFHKFGPILPVGWRDLEQDGKFDLHCYRDRKQTRSADPLPPHKPMENPPHTKLRNVGILLLVAALGIGFLLWQFDRPPVPLPRLQQLHVGMSTNDVQKLLGSPSSAWTRTNDVGEAYLEWAYSRRLGWPTLYIYFTPEGRLGSHRYDP